MQRGDHRIRVIHPIHLLVCKAHLSLKVSQEERQDEQHLKIMLVCCRAFLRELLKNVDSRDSAKAWLKSVEVVMKLAESKIGKSATKNLGINWCSALPMKELDQVTDPALVSFREIRLKHWLQKVKCEPEM